jgi:hypothetical protein
MTTLLVRTPDGQDAGSIELRGGQLVPAGGAAAGLARTALRKAGNAAGAYALLNGFDNGYLLVGEPAGPQALGFAPADAEVTGVHVPGYTGQGWSSHETMLVVRWLFAHPDAWAKAMEVARDPLSNPHTVADTLHEQLVPRSELTAIVGLGFDPAKVNWLEIAHELLERRKDPLPLAGTISGQVDLAGWDTAWLTEHRGRGGQWVKNLPGGYTQATFPGMPRGAAPPAWEAAARQLDTDLAAGIKSESKPHAKRGLQQGEGANFFGNSADTSVVTFANGHKWVRKRDLPDEEFENEVLTSRVSDAIGAGAPPAIKRDGDEGTELWEPFLKGAKPAIEWEGGQNEDGEPIDNDPQEMYDTPAGIRIGVLDNLVDNRDRHEGNWMVVHNRKTGLDSPLPIDHGRVRFGDTTRYGSGAFGENLDHYDADNSLLSEIPQAEWDTWRGKLGALQGDFSELDRDGDYQQMMANFNQMEDTAAAGRGKP